jgi:hypothetical protein
VAKVSIYDMSGNLIQQVFEGEFLEGWATTINIDAQTLDAGMYQIQISSKEFVTTKKLLVTE